MATVEQLQTIMPNATAEHVALFAPELDAARDQFQINTVLREAAFLSQIAQETGEFRWLEEIWGPTAAQSLYEPPSAKATELGNDSPGDGERYKGRGLIQLTGKANYARANTDLGLAGTESDIVQNPQLVAEPHLASLTAGLYWQWRNINQAADAQDLQGVTKLVNGGLTAYDARLAYYQKALAVLGAAAVHVVLDGTDISASVSPYLASDGHVMVALRPIAQSLGITIQDTSGGQATLQLADGSQSQIPLTINGDVGYVAIADLPLTVEWDASSQTVTATTANS